MARGRPSEGKSPRVSVSMPTKLQKDLVMSVVAYEAKLRGCSKGQACFELVMQAVDTDSYPRWVRERLGELVLESDEYVVAQALRRSVAGEQNDGNGAE